MNEVLEKIIDVKGAASLLNVTHCRVLQLIYAKRIPARRLSVGWIMTEDDLAKVRTFGKSGRPRFDKKQTQASGKKA
jgi:hypothetical protein